MTSKKQREKEKKEKPKKNSEGKEKLESKKKPEAKPKEKLKSEEKPKAEPKKKSKAEKKPKVEETEGKEEPKVEETEGKEEPKVEEKLESEKKPEGKSEEEKQVKVVSESKKTLGGGIPSEDLSSWTPKTRLGEKVYRGEITSMHDVIRLNTPIKEVEIAGKLLPELGEEILHVGRVQRTTDSGRRMRFRIVTAVGNNNGFVGVGVAKGKEAGPTIRKAIKRAKLNVGEIKRGCGSWECGCGNPHTVPTRVSGKSGSVEVTLIPAPRGVGLVCGEITRKILTLAGIADVWTKTTGHTRTSINLARAVYSALVNTNYVKLKEQDTKKLGIVTGQA